MTVSTDESTLVEQTTLDQQSSSDSQRIETTNIPSIETTSGHSVVTTIGVTIDTTNEPSLETSNVVITDEPVTSGSIATSSDYPTVEDQTTSDDN